MFQSLVLRTIIYGDFRECYHIVKFFPDDDKVTKQMICKQIAKDMKIINIPVSEGDVLLQYDEYYQHYGIVMRYQDLVAYNQRLMLLDEAIDPKERVAIDYDYVVYIIDQDNILHILSTVSDSKEMYLLDKLGNGVYRLLDKIRRKVRK
jgi:hypothetical protein